MRDRKNLHAMIFTGLAYGIGLAGGTVLAIFLLNNQVVEFFASFLDSIQLFLRLFFSIFLIFILVGFGGGVGGGIGGWGLGRVIDLEDKRRVIWRSATSFFITHAVLIIPFLLLTAIVGFLNANLDVQFSKLPQLFAFYGLIYGAVVGLLLGWLIVGFRQTLGVFLASTFGFAIGGFFAGAGLFWFSKLDDPGFIFTRLIIAGLIFLFGAAGGSAIGLAFQYTHEARSIFPKTRAWRWIRNIALFILAVILLSAFGKLIHTFTIRQVDLAQSLMLSTEGSHWQPVDTTQTALSADGQQLEGHSRSRFVEVLCDDASGQINLEVAGSTQDLEGFPPCYSEPAVAEDSNGRLHLIWYSDETYRVTGTPSSGHFLLESIEQDSGWSEPAIIASPSGEVQPVLAPLADGRLQLVWDDQGSQQQLTYAVYNCDDAPLTDLGQVVYDVVRREEFRPASDPVPYCQNQFDQIIFTPNPTSPDNTAPKSEHGAFDRVAELVEEAEYEVLFVTMQWDAPSADTTSPGDTLAQAVNTLYEKVKANPEAYPRGMTVRIMLGNIPDLAIFEPTSQITHLMQDLHDAGLRKMVDDEIGWRLELANYGGIWPHAHSKFVVVDGKVSVAAGFNYSYLHLDKDHPSGQGLDMTDLGIQITGPMAQSVMAAYDDLWTGSDHYTCSRFPPPIPYFWFLWCKSNPAQADHTPEVMRFYATDGDTNAFALHHTMRFLESDEAILAAILGADETIDLYEVNFSLDLICIIATLVKGACDRGGLAPPYMQALLTAIVKNDVHIRVIGETSAMNGLENRIALNWLENELEQQGKTENLEFRFFNGKMHDKGALIDEELLIIGSQNFHWSAWDTPSLTEYNIATDDPEAVDGFLKEFEYQWERGIPWEDQIEADGVAGS